MESVKFAGNTINSFWTTLLYHLIFSTWQCTKQFLSQTCCSYFSAAPLAFFLPTEIRLRRKLVGNNNLEEISPTHAVGGWVGRVGPLN